MTGSKRIVRRGLVVAAMVLACLPAFADQQFNFVPSHFGSDSGSPFVPRSGDAEGSPTAVQNLNSGLFYTSIQAAVTAALADDVLQVNDNPLAEGQVVIDKNLTIRGATGAEVIQASVDTGTSGDARGWFVVETGVDVTIEDLSFDGTGHLIWQAIRVKGSGTFNDLTFDNIQYNASGPNYRGNGIATIGPISVSNLSFTNMGRLGILLFEPGANGSVVEDVSYVGKGAGGHLDYAVEVGAGAQATLRRISATSNRGTGTGSDASSGILVSTFFGPGTVATIESCNLVDNSVGLGVGIVPPDTSAADVSLTRFFDNFLGLQADADTTITSAENNWWGCNEGPGTADCDGAVGPAGLDVNPWLVLGLTPDAAVINQGSSTNVTADLVFNLDGVDMSGTGTVVDGIDVAFGTNLGSVNPAAGTTVAGEATTQFDAPLATGTATLSATVDNETVTTDIEIVIPVELQSFSIE